MMKPSVKFIEFLAVGNMTAAKELVNKYHEDPCVRNRINYSAKNQLAAMNACRSGNLEILKWIYDLGGFNPRLDDYRGFRISCTKGYLEMTQWIFDLSACDDVTFERTFIKTCINRRFEVCKWMIQTRSQLLSLITQELLEKAKECVSDILSTDPKLKLPINSPIRDYISHSGKSKNLWRYIS